MTTPNAHIIRKQIIEINFESLDDAMGVQDRIAEIFYERLQPRMESLFDELAGKGYRITAERVEIDCGMLTDKNWEEEWIDNTLRKLKAELLTLSKKKIDPEHTTESFFFFLQNGRLPWNSRIQSTREFENELIINAPFLEKLEIVLRESVISFKRLFDQFSKDFLKQLTDSIIKQEMAAGKQNLYAVGYFSETNKRNVQEAVLRLFIEKKKIPAKENRVRDSEEIKRIEKEKREKGELSEEIYIHNAGLIILHPFLPILFERLALTKDGQWISGEAQQTAAGVMEFSVTGTEEFSEFDIPLNKILCAIPVEDTLAIVEVISEETRSAGEELLQEVIRHWAVLKNTGIEALRETFLQRNGKLTQVDHGWFLQVEQKAADVLLGSLPWGIGTIKLPWMQELLFVEWA